MGSPDIYNVGNTNKRPTSVLAFSGWTNTCCIMMVVCRIRGYHQDLSLANPDKALQWSFSGACFCAVIGRISQNSPRKITDLAIPCKKTFSEALGGKDSQQAGQKPACKIQLWTFNMVPCADFSFGPKIMYFDEKEWRKSAEINNTRSPSYCCVLIYVTNPADSSSRFKFTISSENAYT